MRPAIPKVLRLALAVGQFQHQEQVTKHDSQRLRPGFKALDGLGLAAQMVRHRILRPPKPVAQCPHPLGWEHWDRCPVQRVNGYAVLDQNDLGEDSRHGQGCP